MVTSPLIEEKGPCGPFLVLCVRLSGGFGDVLEDGGRDQGEVQPFGFTLTTTDGKFSGVFGGTSHRMPDPRFCRSVYGLAWPPQSRALDSYGPQKNLLPIGGLCGC